MFKISRWQSSKSLKDGRSRRSCQYEAHFLLDCFSYQQCQVMAQKIKDTENWNDSPAMTIPSQMCSFYHGLKHLYSASQQKNALKPVLSVQMRCLAIWLSSSAFPAHGFHGALRAERERWDTSLQIEFRGDLFIDVSVRELFCHEVRIKSIFESTVLHGFMGCVENYETAERKSPSKNHLMLFAPRGAALPEAGRHQRRAPQWVTSCWLTALSTPTWTDPLP